MLSWRTIIKVESINGVEVIFSQGPHYYYAQYSRYQNTHTHAVQIEVGEEAALEQLRGQVAAGL